VTLRAALAAGCLVALAACGHPLFRPPAGPGVPAPEAAGAWEQATKVCRGATTFVAELRVSGRVGDDRFPSLTVESALDNKGSVYLGATYSGQPIFLMAGGADRATLWLRRDNRAVVDAPGAILAELLGVPLSPERLLAVLTGCATRSVEIREADRRGRLLRVVTPDAVVFLEQQQGAWRTRAAQVDGFSVQYTRDGTSVPQRILIDADPGRPRASLDVRVSQAELNGTVEPQHFTPPSAASNAAPLTLAELRSALRDSGRD
jgi:hypothetical protein